MKKRLLVLLVGALSLLTGNVMGQTWNFSNSELSGTIADGSTQTYTVGDNAITVVGKMTVLSESITVDNVTYTKGIYGDGTSNSDGSKAPSRRYLSFNVDGPGTLKIIGQARSDSRDYAVMLIDGSNGINNVGSSTFAAKNEIKTDVFDVTKAGTVYLYYPTTKDIKFYLIQFEATPSTPAITSFKVTLGEDVYDATIEDKSITLELPFGTDLTDITPEIDYVIADSYTPTGSVDFSGGAVDFKLFDDQSTLLETYAVTITTPDVKSDDATLKSLTIDDVLVTGFDPEVLEYNVELPYSLTFPVVAAEVNDQTAVMDAITQLTEFPGTVTVKVTAQDEIAVLEYKINFTQVPPSTACSMSNFMLKCNGVTYRGIIDDENETITVKMHSGAVEATDLTALTPVVLKYSGLATCSPAATEAQDFSSGAVTYTVTAEDGETKKEYAVSVELVDLTWPVADIPYETTFSADFELSDYFCGDLSFNGAYASSDFNLWLEGTESTTSSVVRMNSGNDNLTLFLPKCGTFEIGLSATGGRDFNLYVNGEKKVAKEGIKSKVKETLTYNVDSNEPVIIAVENVGTGGATIGSLKIGNYTPPIIDGINDVSVSGIKYANGILYNANNAELVIYSIDGKKLLESSGNVDMNAFRSGMYIVKSTEGSLKIVK